MKAELVKLPNNDLGPVNVARVSFDKESELVNGKLVDGDARLIKYLASHDHWTPFSHNRVTFWSTEGNPIISLNLLTPELSAGLVHKHDASYVRHSLYGWICLLKNGLIPDSSYKTYINNYLCHIFPETMKSYGFLAEQPKVYHITHVDSHSEKDPDFIDYTMREDIPIFVARQR